MLRRPDLSRLETELSKVERHLKSLDADVTLSTAERELEKSYFMHRQQRLRLLLTKSRSSSHDPVEQVEQAHSPSSNEVKPSDESWKVITPQPLWRAVLNIREDFERLCDDRRDYFNDKCFKDLHPIPSGMTEPGVFKNYFYCCIEAIRAMVKYAFSRFLEISFSQTGLIGAASIKWASLQIVDLIAREDRLAEDWIKSVCDQRNHRPASTQEFIEKVVFRTDWRAPNWLVMRPNGNAVYDASSAWERMNETETSSILRYLAEDRWILLLESTLEKLVGATYEVLARRKISTESKPRGEGQETRAKAANRTQPSRMTKPLMLKYRSGIKRAILGALTKNPTATDAEVCRLLDADGGEELPVTWRTRKEDRSFFAAYARTQAKRKIEIAISKIRRDLRDRGFLD